MKSRNSQTPNDRILSILKLILNICKAELNDKIPELSHLGCWEWYIREKNIPQSELDEIS